MSCLRTSTYLPTLDPPLKKKNDEIATEKVDTAVDPVSIDATRVDSVAEPGVIETTAPSAVLRSNHDRVLRIDNHATAVSTESVPPHETESTNSQIHPDDSAVAESSPKPLDSQTDSANSIVSDLPPNESPQTVQLTNEIGADAQQTELNTISAPHDSTTSPESSHEPSDIDNHDSKAATADASLLAKWNQAIAGLNELFAEYAQTAIAVKINGNGVWNIAFPAGFELAKQQCEQPEATQKLTRALSNYLQTPTQVAFTIDTSVRAIKPPSRAANDAQMAQERVRQASQEPIIQLFKETFKCSITRVDPPNPSKPASEPPAKTPKQDVGSGS